MSAVGHNIIVLLAILECVWVCLALYEVFYPHLFFPLNIMIHSSPAFSKKKTKLYNNNNNNNNNNMEVKPKDITLQNINIFRVMAEGIPRSLSVNLLIIARNRPLASLERELGLNKVPTDVYCRSECIKEF
jgi:hypothetical protein